MRYALWFRSIALYIVMALVLPLPAFSQEGSGGVTRQELQQKRFPQEELAQMLAPIALYPDALVSQVLMASTYPLEIVAADRWVEQNSGLKGDDLAKALEEQAWDPSVKSLVNFPSVLSMMSKKLEITAKLGDAFLSQEREVMDTIQMLRKKALEAGNLKSSREQKVVVEEETVIIEPAVREVIYVPVYDPLVVYGPWMFPAFPPFPFFFLPPPPLVYFSFAPPFFVGFAWGYAWGGCNWHHRSVYVDVHRHYYVNNRYIDRTRYIRHYERIGVIDRDGQGRWRHDPSHRRGVAYRDAGTAERFGQSPARLSRGGDARGGGELRTRGRLESPVTDTKGSPPGEVRGRTRRSGGGDGYLQPGEKPGGVRTDRKGGRGVSPGDVKRSVAPKRESAFSGGFRDGAGARSASERGRASRGFSLGGGGRSGGGKRLDDAGGGRGGGGHR